MVSDYGYKIGFDTELIFGCVSRIAVATVVVKSDCPWETLQYSPYILGIKNFVVYSISPYLLRKCRSMSARHCVECHGLSGAKVFLLMNIIARIVDDSDAAALPQYKMSYRESCVCRLGLGNKWWAFLITREALVVFR